MPIIHVLKGIMSLDTKGIETGIKRVLGNVETLQKKLDKTSSTFKTAAVGIGAAAAAILGPVAAAVHKFDEMGSRLNDLSKRTGLSVEALSSLTYAASQTGTAIESVEVAVRKMSTTIAEAAQGSKTAVDALSRLGLNAQQLLKLKPEDQFRLISARIAAIENPTLRAAAAVEVFGRSGTDLLPMIDELKTLEERARELGITFSQADAEAADRLGDAFGDVKTAAGALAFQVGAALAPEIERLTVKVIDYVKRAMEWVKEHRDLVVTFGKIVAGLAAVTAALLSYAAALKAASFALGPFSTLVTKLPALLSSARVAILSVDAAMAGLAIPIGIVVAAVYDLVKAWEAYQAIQGIREQTRIQEELRAEQAKLEARAQKEHGMSIEQISAKLDAIHKQRAAANPKAPQAATQTGSETEDKRPVATDELRKSQLGAMGRGLPAFDEVRSFFDTKGVTGALVTQFAATIEGATPELAAQFGQIFDQLQQAGQATTENLDALAKRFAQQAQANIQAAADAAAAAEAQQRADEHAAQVEAAAAEKHHQAVITAATDVQEFSNSLTQLQSLPVEQADQFRAAAFNLFQQLQNGTITADQFSQSMSNLSAQTHEAAQAAEAAAAAEQRKAILAGKFSPEMMQQALEQRLFDFRMSQFGQQADVAFQRFLALNGLLPKVSQAFGKVRDSFQDMGERIQNQLPSGERVQQGLAQLDAFFRSPQGMVANIQNAVSFLMQRLQVVDTNRARLAILEQIRDLQQQAVDILAAQQKPFFDQFAFEGIIKDPGLQSGGGANVNVNFRSLVPASTQDARRVVDYIQDEMRRGGRRL